MFDDLHVQWISSDFAVDPEHVAHEHGLQPAPDWVECKDCYGWRPATPTDREYWVTSR